VTHKHPHVNLGAFFLEGENPFEVPIPDAGSFRNLVKIRDGFFLETVLGHVGMDNDRVVDGH
jgi:hypothetical protein